MATQKRTQLIAEKLSYIVGFILVLLPFHAPITTWLGSNFGHYDLFKIWKEILITLISPLVVWLLLKDKSSAKRFLKTPYVKLFVVYILLHLGLGLWALHNDQVNSNALIYALIINLRFFWFFIVCLVLASHSEFLKRNWQKIIIIPSISVIGFGLIQKFILPLNFLSHIGYGPQTIPAYQTVDNNINLQRIQSTLRGANPLGAYLLLPLTAYLYWPKILKLRLGLGFFGLVALYYSYSRSAWIGLLASLIYLLLVAYRGRINAARLVAGFTVIGLSMVVGYYALRSSNMFQDAVLHTSTISTSSRSSNSERLNSLKSAYKDVIHQPLGRGPGTAGPASARNNKTARIAENYYLQIAQEIGVAGLAIFILMNFYIAKILWTLKTDALAQVLLATLLAISIINLFSHAWADDTLSLIWWGLAGVAISPAILKHKRLSDA